MQCIRVQPHNESTWLGADHESGLPLRNKKMRRKLFQYLQSGTLLIEMLLLSWIAGCNDKQSDDEKCHIWTMQGMLLFVREARLPTTDVLNTGRNIRCPRSIESKSSPEWSYVLYGTVVFVLLVCMSYSYLIVQNSSWRKQIPKFCQDVEQPSLRIQIRFQQPYVTRCTKGGGLAFIERILINFLKFSVTISTE